MIEIIYKNKRYKVKKIEPYSFSFGGGLEIVDNGKKNHLQK